MDDVFRYGLTMFYVHAPYETCFCPSFPDNNIWLLTMFYLMKTYDVVLCCCTPACGTDWCKPGGLGAAPPPMFLIKFRQCCLRKYWQCLMYNLMLFYASSDHNQLFVVSPERFLTRGWEGVRSHWKYDAVFPLGGGGRAPTAQIVDRQKHGWDCICLFPIVWFDCQFGGRGGAGKGDDSFLKWGWWGKRDRLEILP